MFTFLILKCKDKNIDIPQCVFVMNEIANRTNKMERSKYTQSIIKIEEVPDGRILNKNRFEEIEDKLEEMFAGIEDEHLVNSLTEYGRKNTKNTFNVDTNFEGSFVEKLGNNISHELIESKDLLFATKAIKKCNKVISEMNSSSPVSRNVTDPEEMKILQTLPSRKGLLGTKNNELFRFALSSSDKRYKEKYHIDPKMISKNNVISKLLAPPDYNVLNNNTENLIKNKREKREYTKNVNRIRYNIRNIKQKIINTKGTSGRKPGQKKIKQQKLQTLLPFEINNDIDGKQQQIREIETKNRSPFILVKNDGSITVVNTLLADECNDKFMRSKKHNNHERKTAKGCHSSTLSNKYDADTADSTWICVFCKKGPHKSRLGDLFGPYLISADCDEYWVSKDSTRAWDGQPLCIKTAKPSKCAESTFQNIPKRNDYEEASDYLLGMSKISNGYYEIWIHEDCAIWAPNIFVIGSQLAGLEDAVWNSTRHECAYCLKPGALLCCFQRDCKTPAHVPCAREFNWLLDESLFWAYCRNHV